MENLLLVADIVLPISSEPIQNGAVAISDGVIQELGKRSKLEAKYSNYKKIISNNSILLPGFINAHIHLELGWIKNRLGNYNNFIEWLLQIIKSKKDDITEKTIQNSVKKGIEEQILSGVTTVGEISSYGGLDINILKQSGLRTILFKEFLDRNIESIDSTDFEEDELFEERLFPHSAYSCSPDTLHKIFSHSGELNLTTGIHLSESQEETNFLKNISNGFDNVIYPFLGRKSFSRVSAESPVKYISRFNKKTQSKITYIHMVNINEKDMDHINNNNVGIVLCPRSNILLKVGKPDLELLNRLENVGLGTDGLSSNYNLNYIEEIRTINNMLLENNIQNSSFLSVYYATLGGARSLFIDEKIGSIEQEKDADLLCINFGDNKPLDPYMSVISSESNNIEYSMVKGKFLYKKDGLQ